MNPSLPPILRPALTIVAFCRHKISGEFRRIFGRYRDELDPEPPAKRRFPLLFAGNDTTLAVDGVDVYLLPRTVTADAPCRFPRFFLPKVGAAAEVEAALTDAKAMGRMPARTFAALRPDGFAVVVRETEEDANGRVELAAAEVAEFRERVGDVILMLRYTVS